MRAEDGSGVASAGGTVLLVDDEPDLLEMLALTLKGECEVRTASDAAGALEILEREPIAVVISDQRMPGLLGSELLAQVRRRWPLVGRVILSAFTDARDLMSAVNEGGVQAYLTKPLPAEQLRLIARQFVERHQLAVQNERLRRELEEANARLAAENDALVRRERGRFVLSNLVARSPAMRAVLDRIERVAPVDAMVLITGETGTGKEVVATTLHYHGPRASGPFVPVNCGGLSEELLQSALFGHVRGAFTGALRDQVGYFEAASGGTLFLDEIAEMSPTMQVKLLRALQDRSIVRVGETQPRKVDVRVVAATHRDLESAVAAGRFRQDLFFRLNVFRIHVPPLRERAEDLPELARRLLSGINARLGTVTREIEREALARLAAHAWPGNVRELENELEQAVVLAAGRPALRVDDLSDRLRGRDPAAPAPRSTPPHGSLAARIEALEREAIEVALREQGGNLSRTAQALDLSRAGLRKKMRRLGLASAGAADDGEDELNDGV